ncbi:uncharacterized protein ALTATR162_LOCUS2149 [Alternaria atra]|uniref:Uncharacterized protein n=1 Tax=Alternaria atra TaxID=119953 RepID=A0A8J2MWS8_9PLEO|nr:uncharacterized protein ALTATR162_LOCUS2149 [Alternaria atra]CAG5148096.1 unnamed protein product [Alternaria atra]
MEPETLQWLGWPYVSRLYDRIKSTDTLTFRTWSLFRKAFPKDIDRHSTFRVLDWESENLLPSVIDRLVKLDLGMLTFLCIQTFNLTIDQLIALAKINTLAVLALEVGRDSLAFWDGTMSIHTIRNWGRSVSESGAFKELRVLVVDGCNSLPRRSVLKSISSFPSLNLAGIFGSDDPPKAEDCWEDWHLRFPPNGRDETLQHSVWGTSDTSRAFDMRRLYDISLEISKNVPTGDRTYQSLSMQYTQHNKTGLAGEPAWFIRELKDQPVRPMKRVQEDKSRLDGKRRKVRDDKKVDMGSLLGSFT